MTGPPPRTLLDMLERRARTAPGHPALFWEEAPVSSESLWIDATRFAAQLRGCGVTRGARVLIALPNGPDFFRAFYGTLRAGAIAVPLPPASGPERLARVAGLCGSRHVVVGREAATSVPGMQTVAAGAGASPSLEDGWPPVAPGDVAFLQYTSGSTGAPKGVMLTHEGLLSNVRQLIDAMSLTEADCFVSWLPVFHDMGLILMTMAPFFLGAKLVLLPTALANPRPWLTAIARHQGTVTAAPDFAYRLTLRHVRDPGAYDLSTLRVALNAAEPVRPRTIDEFERAFGLRHVMIAGYGLAEATVGVSTSTPGTAPLVDRRGVVCVGRPFAGIDVRIIADDRPLDTGCLGEVVVRSPANTPGYFDDPEETRRLLWRDGYIRTGDLGYLDPSGRLFITGRLKNVIKHAGETVFPQEVEQIADRHPAVRRSAAVGIDSGRGEGEQLYVFAELRRAGGHSDSTLFATAVDIVQAVRAELGLRPGRVYLLRPHAIPVTHNGKVRHVALRDAYAAGSLRVDGGVLYPDF